jgi:uncharacterized membrane protein
MNKFVVTIFSDETKAYEGLHELQKLHREGTVAVYGTVVAQRGADGKLVTKQRNDEGPLGMGVGTLVGALIGLFGGPVGMAVGVVAGGIAGTVRDVFHAQVSDEFLEEVQRDLTPGKFAVIAEVSEDWIAPIDVRMEAHGGTVVRERREDFIDDMLERKANARRAEFAQWKAELQSKKVERMESNLSAKVQHAREKLERTAEQARERLGTTKQELDAKLAALEEQAATAKPEVKTRVTQRIAELRKDFERRESKLQTAYELAHEALQP